MSKLVIAEKPMLARDIARAITGKEVSESARLPISGNGYTVCACAGHLLELVKPDAIDPKWGMPWSLLFIGAFHALLHPRDAAEGAEIVAEVEYKWRSVSTGCEGTPELLLKNNGGLCGAHHNDCVDSLDVNSFIRCSRTS